LKRINWSSQSDGLGWLLVKDTVAEGQDVFGRAIRAVGKIRAIFVVFLSFRGRILDATPFDTVR